jgi:ATP-binding cassette subfamily C protein
MIGCLILSGLTEGIGVMSLLPILEFANNSNSQSDLGRAINYSLSILGLKPDLFILLGITVVGMVLKGFFLWFAMRQVGYTTAQVTADLRLMLIRSLLSAKWSYFISKPAGYFANAISSEALRASMTYRGAAQLIANAIQVMIYVVLALLVSWRIAVMALLAASLIMVILGGLVKISKSAGRNQTKYMKLLIEHLTDALQGIKPLKAMAREKHLLQLFESEANSLNKAQQRLVIAKETLTAFQEPIMVFLLAIGLYIAITFGDQPFSTLTVMAFLFYRMVTRINSLQSNYQAVVMDESAFKSLINNIQTAESEKEEVIGELKPTPVNERILFDSVSFAYGDKEILKGISFEIPAGKFVAIIGSSGAGKTTIADLLIGLYRPKSGQIYIDGIPLDRIEMNSWRKLIGYVPQEMFLFHDTIHKNITLGDDTVSIQDVMAALKSAEALDFVSALPQGIDTVVGERGSKISGGQRQRIAIARALAHKPALLILDEITTALDPLTEAEICETLKKLAGKVTIVSISHQPAVIKAADIVYRLDGGTIVVKENSL